MSTEMTEQLASTAERLAHAAEALDRVLEKMDAQQQALNAKVDRIVAAVEDHLEASEETPESPKLQTQIAELQKANEELRAQAARLARKTLPPLVTTLLGKGTEGERLDTAALNRTLQALSVEQRIAVKAEMARAGMID